MAALWRHPNGVYYVTYMRNVPVKTADGKVRVARRHRRDSLLTRDRREAQARFRAWEEKHGRRLEYEKLGLAAPVTTVTELWEEFEKSFEASGKRASTLDSYGISMNQFREYLGGDGDLGRVDRDTAKDFLLWRKNEEGTASGANKNLAELRAVFNWGADKGYCLPVFAGIPKFSVTKKEPNVLSDEEAVRLLAAAAELDRTGVGRRMELFLRLCYYNGFRPGEACAATLRNVNTANKTISVTEVPEMGFIPKTNEERTIALYPATAGMIKKTGAWDDGPFLTGYRTTRDKAWRHDWDIVRTVAELPALEVRQLRKNFALRFLQLSGSIMLTRYMMGHDTDTRTLEKNYLPLARVHPKPKTSTWDRKWIKNLGAYY